MTMTGKVVALVFRDHETSRVHQMLRDAIRRYGVP
jgi:hypothetical protein